MYKIAGIMMHSKYRISSLMGLCKETLKACTVHGVLHFSSYRLLVEMWCNLNRSAQWRMPADVTEKASKAGVTYLMGLNERRLLCWMLELETRDHSDEDFLSPDIYPSCNLHDKDVVR